MRLLIVMAPPRPLQGLVKAKRPQILKSAPVLGAALKKRMARAMKNWRCVQSLMMGKGTIRKDVNQRDHLLIEILNAKERPQVLHSRRNAKTNKSRVIIFGKAIVPLEHFGLGTHFSRKDGGIESVSAIVPHPSQRMKECWSIGALL